MTKWKKQRKIVGTDNFEKKTIAKPLVKIVISLQKKLQEEENNRKKLKPRKITFVYASLELSRILKK